MGSGCGDSIVDKNLRPPGKLPVPVALNAGSPTLFPIILHNGSAKVKDKFSKSRHILPKSTPYQDANMDRTIQKAFHPYFSTILLSYLPLQDEGQQWKSRPCEHSGAVAVSVGKYRLTLR